jgi:hypothetical protein
MINGGLLSLDRTGRHGAMATKPNSHCTKTSSDERLVKFLQPRSHDEKTFRIYKHWVPAWSCILRQYTIPRAVHEMKI